MRMQLIGCLFAAALLAGCGSSTNDNGPTLGDRGAGSTAPGNAGGGTASTVDSGISAQNLDPRHGTEESRGTTGTANVTTSAGGSGTTETSSH
jgi:hypothetical protein